MQNRDFSKQIRDAQSSTITYFLIIVDNQTQKKSCFRPDNPCFQNRSPSARFRDAALEYGQMDWPGKSRPLLVASSHMSIVVVCPGCGKRFKVNNKYAGKTGPCPNCKRPLKVPDKTEEVTIHVPEQFELGGRNANGQLLGKPIVWKETKFNIFSTAAVASAAVAILAAALMAGKLDLFALYPYLAPLGLTLISPLLALTAYTFLYNDELEPYQGMSLLIRATICGLLYALLWGVYVYLEHTVLSGELWNWAFLAPPFFIAGASIASLTLDLASGNAFFHYAFYLLVTIFLRWTAGLDWIWNINRL
jgi:hypothetical protein